MERSHILTPSFVEDLVPKQVLQLLLYSTESSMKWKYSVIVVEELLA